MVGMDLACQPPTRHPSLAYTHGRPWQLRGRGFAERTSAYSRNWRWDRFALQRKHRRRGGRDALVVPATAMPLGIAPRLADCHPLSECCGDRAAGGRAVVGLGQGRLAASFVARVYTTYAEALP